MTERGAVRLRLPAEIGNWVRDVANKECRTITSVIVLALRREMASADTASAQPAAKIRRPR
jgi:hypothetical protein